MPSLLENAMPAVAKITAKGQTTIPQDVRAHGTAIVRRVQPLDVDYLCAVEATMSEWAGVADEEAYRDL